LKPDRCGCQVGTLPITSWKSVGGADRVSSSSIRQLWNGTTAEVRFYLNDSLGGCWRAQPRDSSSHWSIENGLHWVLLGMRLTGSRNADRIRYHQKPGAIASFERRLHSAQTRLSLRPQMKLDIRPRRWTAASS